VCLCINSLIRCTLIAELAARLRSCYTSTETSRRRHCRETAGCKTGRRKCEKIKRIRTVQLMPSGILKTAYPWASTPLEHLGVAGRAPKTRESKKNCTLGALQMKMSATCGIQKFRRKEKIKHLSKYWGGATPATPAALTPMSVSIRTERAVKSKNATL